MLHFVLMFGLEDWQEPTLRLVLAAVAGGLVGAERARHAQIAGIRTHAILAIGAALTMLVSVAIATTAMRDGAGGVVYSDPGRVAAQVISGIGFLGAGAIIRLGNSIRGLTTAASLWTVAGIGLAIGAGYYVGAAVATVLLIGVLDGVDRVADKMHFGRKLRTLKLVATAPVQEAVVQALAPHRIVARVARLQETRADGRLTYHFSLHVPDPTEVEAIVAALRDIESVTELRVE
jgi:putative Mg2+ transporter-C (MgtC) family protein